MSWDSKTLPAEEVEALEKIWPLFEEHLLTAEKPEFTVDEFKGWVEARPALGVVPRKSSQPKGPIVAENPDRVVLDVQNALYHLSGNSEKYVITESSRGQVRPLDHVGRMKYRLG